MDKITEQMAIEALRKNHCTNNEHCTDNCMHGEEFCAYAMAIQALEERQQYRAIGTVEELQALKEKSVAKKPRKHTAEDSLFYCPSCGLLQTVMYHQKHCKECGQHLDWE